jgi:hypothetical protein
MHYSMGNMIYFLLSICSKLDMQMLKVPSHNALLFMIICSFRRLPSNCGFDDVAFIKEMQEVEEDMSRVPMKIK